jgi:hypothetical protein
MAKQFKLSKEQIKRLVPHDGGCMASDRITVDGRPVGFMYREAPAHHADTGWRFLAGDESDEYMAESSNHNIYAVNTIANYDPSIIPLLGSPEGSAFERTAGSSRLVPVEDWDPPVEE